MDPVGVALGAASLAIQALDGVRKGELPGLTDVFVVLTLCPGFDIFEQAALADKQFQHYKIALKMHYDQLNTWSEMTGLAQIGSDKRNAASYERQFKHNGPLVVAALTQIRLDLKDLRRTELKYDALIEEHVTHQQTPQHGVHNKSRDIAEPSAGEMVGSVLDVQSSVPERKENIVKRGWTAVTKSVKQPKRFVWAVRDGEKFDKSLNQIKDLIGYLKEMLTRDQMSQLVESASKFNLMLLQLTNDMTEVKALMWAGHIRDPRLATTELDGLTLVDGVAKADESDFWQEAARFSIDIAEGGADITTSRKMTAETVSKMIFGTVFDDSTRTLATMPTGQQVWIEWKSFEPVSRAKRTAPQDTIQRVERLVTLLHVANKPTQFCVPRCLGYFQEDEKSRFGLVYEPPVEHIQLPPVSLLSCFAAEPVTLGAKIAVAQQLAQWLMYLHVVNWMHKGLRSASILFFPEAGSKDLGRAFVTGFEYSRIATGDTSFGPTLDDVKRAMYVHPDYLGFKRQLGYKKTYDVYSLGIILIEIAYWQPFAEIYRSTASAPTEAGGDTSFTITSINLFREQILAGELGVLDHVARVMCERYAAATKTCLLGMRGFGLGDDDDQANVQVAASMQQGFVDEVIDVLKGVVV